MSLEDGMSVSPWQELHENGVLLEDEKIDQVFQLLTLGRNQTYDFLEIPQNERSLGFTCNTQNKGIGYQLVTKEISVTVDFLNKLYNSKKPISDLKIDVPFIEGGVPIPKYLVNAAREETIHHFQYTGHPRFKTQLTDNLNEYTTINDIEKMCLDFEVEARKTTDEIAVSHHEEPLWANVDVALQNKFPDTYNKPLVIQTQLK